jgi:hypothetical protein
LLNRVDLVVRELDVHARRAIDLISAEAIRPLPAERERERRGSAGSGSGSGSGSGERSSAIPPPNDHVIRQESRVHG